MTRSIEHDGISCAVYTTAKTEVDPGGPGLPPDTVLYAAWRWLYRCRALYRPLTALCLAFRRKLVRDSSCRLAVSRRPGPTPFSLSQHGAAAAGSERAVAQRKAGRRNSSAGFLVTRPGIEPGLPP